MTNAISGNKRAMEDILGLPPKALKSPPGFAKDGKGRRGRIPLPSEEELKTKSFAELMAMMSTKKAAFVSAILRGATGPDAVVEAGWRASNKASGHSRAGHLMQKDPLVRAAIAVARKEIALEVKYDVASSFQDFKEAAEFAMKTENATALVRAREMQSKLFGLLVDRQDTRMLSALSINISGLD
jgi:hypothetical protein